MQGQKGIGLIEALITLVFVVFITLALSKHQGVSLSTFSVASNKAEAIRLVDQTIATLELTPANIGETKTGFDKVAGISTTYTKEWSIKPVENTPAVDVTVTISWIERNGKEEKVVNTKRIYLQEQKEQIKISQAETTEITQTGDNSSDSNNTDSENAKQKGMLLEIKGSFQYTGSAGEGTEVEVSITEGGACETGGGGYSCTVPPGWQGTIEFTSPVQEVRIAPGFASYAGVIASDASSTVFVFQR